MTEPTHLLSNGDIIWTEIFNGKVLVSKEDSNTIIWQGRERSQMVGGQVMWTPGQIHSDIVTTHKVWLQAPDGTEHHFDLSNVPLALREGHHITLVWIGKQGRKARRLFGAYNRNTQERHLVDIHPLLGRSGLRLKLTGTAHWWVGVAVLLYSVATKGKEGLFAGLMAGLVVALLADAALVLFALATKLRFGKYGQIMSLYEQITRVVEERIRVVDASLKPRSVDSR